MRTPSLPSDAAITVYYQQKRMVGVGQGRVALYPLQFGDGVVAQCAGCRDCGSLLIFSYMRYGNGDGEFRSLTLAARYGNPAMMEFHERLCQREADAGTLRMHLVYLEEAVEYVA